MVKAIGGNTLSGIQGVYTFVWAKTGQAITKASESVRLYTAVQTAKLTAADLTATLTRPETEGELI